MRFWNFSKARFACAALGIAAALLAAGCAEAPKAAKPPPIPVFPPPPDEPRFFWERTLQSSADVVDDDKDGALRRMVTGEARKGEGMDKPYGVAVRNGRVYVGDTVARTVVMFDLNARKFMRIGQDNPGKMMMPFGLDFDAAGNLYVVDGSLKKVLVYDPAGKYLRSLGEGIKWARPTGIAIDAKRGRIYIVDIGGVNSDEHTIHVLDLESGRKLSQIGSRGDGQGNFNLPRDAVVGADGLLYVVDSGNFRVQVFDGDGKFLRTFGTIGRQGGQFARPKEIAADNDGNIYVVDSAFGNFQIFNAAGQLLLDVGSRSDANRRAGFMLPSGIAVDVDGRVYMVDQFFRKVEVFRPAAVAAGAPYGRPAASPQATARPAQR